jgi:methionyl-tRNA synthetase
MATGTVDKVDDFMDNLNFSNALEEVWKLIRRTNKYVDETMPWILAKEENTERLDTVLYNLSESLRIVSILIKPFMVKTSDEIRKQLGIEEEVVWDNAKEWGLLKEGSKMAKGGIIFPRLDIEVELERLNNANNALIEKRMAAKNANKPEAEEAEEKEEEITIDDFAKVKLKVAEVLACEDHPKADKLLVLTLKVGDEERQVVSGIKQWYSPEDLIGKKVIVVANLKPVKLRGIESRGMVLAAQDADGKLTLLSTLEDIEDGAIVS